MQAFEEGGIQWRLGALLFLHFLCVIQHHGTHVFVGKPQLQECCNGRRALIVLKHVGSVIPRILRI